MHAPTSAFWPTTPAHASAPIHFPHQSSQPPHHQLRARRQFPALTPSTSPHSPLHNKLKTFRRALSTPAARQAGRKTQTLPRFSDFSASCGVYVCLGMVRYFAQASACRAWSLWFVRWWMWRTRLELQCPACVGSLSRAWRGHGMGRITEFAGTGEFLLPLFFSTASSLSNSTSTFAFKIVCGT